MTPKARRFLEIRQQLSRSANAKYAAFARYADLSDQRVRGTMIYHGAATGRNTGKGPQPLNMLRKSHDGIDTLVQLIRAKDVVGIETIYGSLANALAVATRQMIKAAPGHTFFCGDYSAIEGRGLAWEANETHILEDYISGKDPYKVAASFILKIPYDQVTDEQRRAPGKIAELACGYQGGVNAAKVFGAEGTDEYIKEAIINPWRRNRPATVEFWYGTERAAKQAVNNQGSTVKYGLFQWGCSNGFLYCKLPSGRLLSYYKPEIQERMQPWGKKTMALTYLGYKMVDGKPTQWCRVPTYGGKLVENLTQASMRDILREAKFAVTKAGYRIVLDVYDEILAEVPVADNRDLDEFLHTMAGVNPPWAEGLPLAAEGWQGERYKKG